MMEVIDFYAVGMKRLKYLVNNMSLLEALHNRPEHCCIPHIRCRQDMRDYAGSDDLTIVRDNHFYLILAKFEIIDFASSQKLSRSEVNEILNHMKNWFGNNCFIAEVKANGAYRLLQSRAKKGELTIHSEFVWYMGNERMVEVNLSFNNVGVSK